jgi:hypothetical protein
MAAALATTLLHSPARAALLAFDVNGRATRANNTEATPPVPTGDNTAPGFSAFVLPATPATPSTATVVVDGYTIGLTVFDADGATGGAGAMDDRDRAVPTTAPTLNQLYDDLIFVGNSAGDVGGGLDVAISGPGLAPNTVYRVHIYAFDGAGAVATPVRTANWVDGNNGDAPVLTTAFTVNVPPAFDNQYRFTGQARTDGAGALLLKGRDATAGDIALYMNGLVVDVVPEPATWSLAGLGALVLARGRRG